MTSADPLADVPYDEFLVETAAGPLDASITPPGSKSITNRALICAALARGSTRLEGVLFADDTEAMIDCLGSLGVSIEPDIASTVAEVVGLDGVPRVDGGLLDARLSGTTSRFIAPVAALGSSTVVIDGGGPLRARPMVELFDTLETLGAEIDPLGTPGRLPVQIAGHGLRGGTVEMRGDVSSQFLSAILLAGPLMESPLAVEVVGPLVSEPYVDLTLDVMAAFGADSNVVSGYQRITVANSGYAAPEIYTVEPDASAASYFFAAAAIRGGRVRVQGLGSCSRQGDLAFVDVLERMGMSVRRGDDFTEVERKGDLVGVNVDMSDFSDTAQTLAVVATAAKTPTTITGIGFIRAKETDRIAAVVTELNRLGVSATEDSDGLTVTPAPVNGGTVQTYDDHRMAMSFALLGLVTEGVVIADPHCVAKTYPTFWQDLASIYPTPDRP